MILLLLVIVAIIVVCVLLVLKLVIIAILAVAGIALGLALFGMMIPALFIFVPLGICIIILRKIFRQRT